VVAAILAAALVVHLDVAVLLWDRSGVAVTHHDVDLDRLRSSMTLEEKVEQLHGVGQMRGTTNRRLDVPPFQPADGPHGIGEAVWRYAYRHTDRATAFPVAIALAASWDPELAGAVGAAIAREARAKGRNWLLAPAVDLVRDPRAGRVFESFGEDPHLSSRLGVAYVRAVQAEDVIATPKHFVCHNHESLRKQIDVEVGERALRELYLPPFEAAVREGGALSIMAASHSVNGVHCTEHTWLLRDVLRGEWGFRGVVVSDWKSATSTEASIRAGLDVEMPKALHYGAPLRAAIEDGRVPAALVDDAVSRVLRVKSAVGLFGRPLELDGSALGSPAHRRLAHDAARASIALLVNRSDFLPLRLASGDTVAVLGPLADRAALGGRGSSEVRPLEPVTLVEGLRRVVPDGVRVETLGGWSSAARVAELAGRADAVVLALGLGPEYEGEALDRVGNDLDLPAEQRRLIEQTLEATSNVAVVLFAGSAIGMDPWVDRVPAVLHAWYPGELGGVAVAEVLLGAVNPSGKLPITLPRAASQLPAFATFPERETSYREGVFVGYRHFDAAGLEPLFPFGHGLSYTRFQYSTLRVRARGDGDDVIVDVRFDLSNVGRRPGAEIAQLYLRDVDASVPRPPRELKGFAKVELAPGETRTIEMTLHGRDLAFFDEASRSWRVEPGAFQVQVGSSSRDLRLQRRFMVRPERSIP
jgi:beta-glucosidase